MDQRATTPFSSAETPVSAEELAKLFPQLEIIKLLGQGGMGVVYLARQRKLNRLVALKILLPGQDPSFAERFVREAQTLALLNHPGIVGLHDFGETDGQYYLLMEYIDGVNLRHLLAEKFLKPEQALRIVPQICAALQYAHDAGIAHRDIKPENILLDQAGNVKIADFGLAKILSQAPDALGLTGPQQIMGTLKYMAPEQIEHPLKVDHRADIYSLGVVFYEMLTGELPVGRFTLPSQKAPVDSRLDDVILRALEKQPERRYQQASELKHNVERLTKRDPLSVPPMPAGSKPIHSLVFWQSMICVLVLFVAAIPTLAWTNCFWGIYGISGSASPTVGVNQVNTLSPAEKAGIRANDDILSVENRAMNGLTSFREILDSLTPGQELKLNVKRGEQLLSIPITGVEPELAGAFYNLWQFLAAFFFIAILALLYLAPVDRFRIIVCNILFLFLTIGLIGVVIDEPGNRVLALLWSKWSASVFFTKLYIFQKAAFYLLVAVFVILSLVRIRQAMNAGTPKYQPAS